MQDAILCVSYEFATISTTYQQSGSGEFDRERTISVTSGFMPTDPFRPRGLVADTDSLTESANLGPDRKHCTIRPLRSQLLPW